MNTHMNRNSVRGQGWIEYAIGAGIVLTVTIFMVLILTSLGIGAHDVTGRVTKAFVVPCSACDAASGYVVIHQDNGQDVSFKMYNNEYGLINVGDVCTFSIRGDIAVTPHCTSSGQR